jgi:hypothetical protein
LLEVNVPMGFELAAVVVCGMPLEVGAELFPMNASD